MKVSVVTTVYDRPEHFRMFLRALALQSRPPDEVVVADDGSPAAAAERVRELFAGSGFAGKVVRQEKDGYRLAAARNLALREITGDYVVFLDCDIVLLPDGLATHLALSGADRVLAGNRALLGEAESKRLFGMGGEGPSGADFEAAWAAADKGEAEAAERLFEKHARLRRWHLARPHKPKIIGCHFSAPAEAVRRVNGFDENFVGWGYEDDDFARRLYWAGVRPVSVIGKARAVHLWHPSLAPREGGRHRDRPNRAYFRRWGVETACRNGLVKLG